MLYAQSPQVVPVSDNESSQLWFVELASAPTIEGTAAATLEREESDFHAAAAAAASATPSAAISATLWNGLTVTATAARDLEDARVAGRAGRLSGGQGSRAAAGGAAGPSPDLITAIKMTGADIAQNDLGLTGRGVRVAVMDTGIDFDHPDLGGCFGRGCRVEKGFDFVGDAFNADDDVADSSRPTGFRTTATATARTSRASSARTGA